MFFVSIQYTWCMFVCFGKVGEPAGSEDPVTVRSFFCQYFNCCWEEAKCILSSTVQTSTSRKLQPVQHSTALHCPLQVNQAQWTIPESIKCYYYNY